MNLIESLYDISYFVVKNIRNWKWEMFFIYIFYLFGKRSGMKMTKKYMQKHFPIYFADENEAWRSWATENIEGLGGSQWQWKKSNGSIALFKGMDRMNLNILSRYLRQDKHQDNQLERVSGMKKIIVIDAGHGDKDPGAIGVTGKKEKDFNLTMALKVESLLSNHPSITVLLTRRTDVFLELKQRSDFANANKADAFISIHGNSFNPDSAGTETHYTRSDSKSLAAILQKYTLLSTGLKDRGLKTGNLYVTKNTKMPACLLEPAFLSNPAEENLLFNASFQDSFALNIAKGICEYFGVAYEIVPTPAPQPIPEKNAPYPVMEVTVHADRPRTFVGYTIKNTTWVPSRPIGDLLLAEIGYKKGKVIINGNAVETQLINCVGFVTARDLTSLLGARIFWDKNSPKKVDIYPKKLEV